MKANGNRQIKHALQAYIYQHKTADDYEPQMPHTQPTHTKPGSAARIAVYMERVARGEPIFHPQDEVAAAGTELGTFASLILPKHHRRRS